MARGSRYRHFSGVGSWSVNWQISPDGFPNLAHYESSLLLTIPMRHKRASLACDLNWRQSSAEENDSLPNNRTASVLVDVFQGFWWFGQFDIVILWNCRKRKRWWLQRRQSAKRNTCDSWWENKNFKVTGHRWPERKEISHSRCLLSAIEPIMRFQELLHVCLQPNC